MAVPKHAYIMDYIDDKDLYKAVMFACTMLRQGTPYMTAIRKASYYYQVDMDDVKHYVSQRGGRKEKGARHK